MKPAPFAQIAEIAFILLAALTVYMFVTAAQDGEARSSCTALCALRPAYANQNRKAPDFDLPDITGKRVRLSQFRGKTVIVNFWTKTCRPCLEEMPSLVDLQELLKGEPDVVLLTVSTDEGAEDARDTLKTVLGKDPPFPVLIDPEGEVVGGKFGTKLFPETWFIDPDGVIRARVDGARDWTNPLVLETARMFGRKQGCEIRFDRGKAQGDRRDVCGDVGMPAEEL